MSNYYDLEERMLRFAVATRRVVKNLPTRSSSASDKIQVIRSSGSIGANYIEANENISKKDFLFRLKIARKEAKESLYWLRILQDSHRNQIQLQPLIKEATELRNILSTIISKSENKKTHHS